ncbi:MAG: dTDP-4-amino-4,6-dideoxygalactose transaminase [Capsulimonadales bacterium]|nr:dTDP-4-amino-4,6-dideoxygalactose transaminase [Capsulimonadales bacterium]
MNHIAMRRIPFSAPTIGPDEKSAWEKGLFGSLSGNGANCREAEAILRQRTAVPYALLTSSCTHALEIALMAMDLKPDDEIILPSFTFTSTANVVLRQGARPVFVDIDPRTFNIDPEKIREALTPRTRCLLPVHYAGQGCDMDEILRIARENGLYVLEDAAQAVGATWNDQPLGTFGDVGCFSFHATKNIVCGEGGAFLTRNDALARKAEIIREKGTNRAAFLRGEVDKYTWIGLGNSFILPDPLAALLKVQLERMEEINGARLTIWNRYFAGTRHLEEYGLVRRPYFHPKASNNAHIFGLLIENGRRDEVLARMRKWGVEATFHYVPLHSSPYMQEYFGDAVPHLPITDHVSASLLRLPLSANMTEEDTDYVLEALHAALLGTGELSLSK